MAVLGQSELWPIHSARRLHDKAQQEFLWQFFISGAIPVPNEDMMLLTQSCSIPAMQFSSKEYVVGGQEKYYLSGPSKRGGQVNATFLETEDGKVDAFFRIWANEIDLPDVTVTKATDKVGIGASISRGRRGKGYGDGVTGHSRYGLLRMVKRDGTIGVEFLLTRLQLVSFGERTLDYGRSGALTLSAQMTCDDVVRNVVRDALG